MHLCGVGNYILTAFCLFGGKGSGGTRRRKTPAPSAGPPRREICPYGRSRGKEKYGRLQNDTDAVQSPPTDAINTMGERHPSLSIQASGICEELYISRVRAGRKGGDIDPVLSATWNTDQKGRVPVLVARVSSFCGADRTSAQAEKICRPLKLVSPSRAVYKADVTIEQACREIEK